jgi:hypothetical protein
MASRTTWTARRETLSRRTAREKLSLSGSIRVQTRRNPGARMAVYFGSRPIPAPCRVASSWAKMLVEANRVRTGTARGHRRLLDRLLDGSGVLRDGPAGFGQLPPVRAPLDQADPQHLLQGLDPPGDRRVIDAERGGGSHQTPGVGHHDEVPEVVGAHGVQIDVRQTGSTACGPAAAPELLVPVRRR